MQFLAATQRIDNLKNKTIDVLRKCHQVRERGKLILLMNKVRMSILCKMWNEQKTAMMTALSKKAQSNKKGSKELKKRIGELMSIPQEVRDASLKAYYKLCKERGAKKFIEWRMEQARLQACYPYYQKAIRIRRLVNFEKFNLESLMYKIYKDNESEVDRVMPQLISMELKI